MKRSLQMAIAILIVGVGAPSARGQIQKLPIAITPWQLLDDEIALFREELYVREKNGNLWRFDGRDMNLVANPEGGLHEQRLGFMHVVGDLLYFASSDSESRFALWRTDGSTTELAHRFEKDVWLGDGFFRRNLSVNQFGDTLYLATRTEVHAANGIFRITPVGVEEIPTPPSFQSNPIGFRVGDSVIFMDQERSPARQRNATYYVMRDDSVSLLTPADLGLDHSFGVVGVADDNIYVWSTNESGRPAIFRSDLFSSEELFEPDSAWIDDFEIYDQGTALYLKTDGYINRWNAEEGITPVEDPHTGTIEQWSLTSDESWLPWAKTGDVLSRTIDDKFLYVRIGPDGLEKIPDADLLFDLGGPFYQAIDSWCFAENWETTCVRDGQRETFSYLVPAKSTEVDGRLFWTDWHIHSTSKEDPAGGYRREVQTVINDVGILGNLKGKALITAGYEDGRALWTTDGRDIEFVSANPFRAVQEFEEDELVILTRSDEGSTWTFDGTTLGTVDDYFGNDLDLEPIFGGELFGQEILFQVIAPREHRGLWSRGPEGTRHIASFDPQDKIVVIDSLAYILIEVEDEAEMFVYDGDSFESIAEVAKPSRAHWFVSRQPVIGNALLNSIGGETWVFRKREAVKLDANYDFRGSVVHDDGWLYFTHDDNLWRTNTEIFEQLFPTWGHVELRSQDGSLYFMQNYFRANLVTLHVVRDGRPTQIAGPEKGRSGWAPESPLGLFPMIGEIPYALTGTSLTPLTTEPFLVLGWAGSSLIGTKPHEPGVFSLDVSELATRNEDEAGEPSSFSISSFPNPAGSSATIQLIVDRDDVYVLELLDVLGRSVEDLHRGYIRSGQHSFDLDSGNLVPGVYFARARTPDRMVTMPLVVQGR